MALDAQAQKLVAGLVRVAVMAPTDGPEPDHGLPPAHRQVMLLLGRRDREYRLSDLAGEESHLTYPQMALMAARNSALCVTALLDILASQP